MKIGLIGFGSIGERHYKNLSALGHRVTVFSGRGDIQVFDRVKNWKEFFNSGPYEAIFVTNETAKHSATIKKCLKLSPKGIFIEKPLSDSSRGLVALAKELEKRWISAWVGYNLQFFKPFAEIKKILKAGNLGKIYYLRVFAGQDLREWRQRDYRKIYSAKKSMGGGAMLDLIHDINYPSWLLDDELRPVAGFSGKISDLDIDAEDYAESILIGKKSGVLVSAHQDYLRIPGKRSLEIAGKNGSLSWDSENNEINLRLSGGKKKKIGAGEDRNAMYLREVKRFLDLIRNKEYVSNINEAIRDVKIVEAIKKYGKR